jgi:MYXO-CTERM domain-containing protein
MTDFLASALAQQSILVSNSLATVASECVVIRSASGTSRSILALSQIRDMSTVRLSHPGLLVLASAALLIAAGAHFSKQGDSADWPIALVGLLLLAAYAGSRRAAVCFTSTDGRVQTVFGSPSDAAAIIAAARAAMNAMDEDSAPADSESLAS